MTLKVVALISGGKDSIFNCMEVLAENHQIVALANLHPKDKDELDSYMWQTVGHMGIEKLAEAMELPLYRRETLGKSAQTGKYYEPQSKDDEVEDLYTLLKQVKDELDVNAVACGAIFSDYQRVRVENVCSRLNLVSLAYLWRREQCDLLQEMIDCQIHAIVIKVASLGLTPDRHLGKSIKDIQSHLQQMHEKYGLNICGEGGEYETFTLDCPLFKKRIVVEDHQIVVSSSDPVCPVGYINFTKLRLVPKEAVDFNKIVIKRSQDFLLDLNYDLCDLSDPDLSETELELIEKENNKLCGGKSNQSSCTNLSYRHNSDVHRVDSMDDTTMLPASPIRFEYEKRPLRNLESVVSNAKGWYWIAGIQGIGISTHDGVTAAMNELEELVRQHNLALKNLCYITLYVRNISEYQILNKIYSEKLNFQNPPTRVCVECPLPENCHIILEAVAFKAGSEVSEIEHKRHTMHVQSISHWSPANIGPYSQSTRVGDITYISGQIGLIPGTMTIIEGGIKQECKLTLRHINRVAKAMSSRGCLRDVVQGICFVVHPSYIHEARRQWERRTANAIMDYIVVPTLPRNALVEWQVWIHAHNDKFDYEETGRSVGLYTISLRRRWNYENNCAAIVCYVSTGMATTSTTKLSELSEETINRHNSLAQNITQEELNDILKYILGKILQGYPAHQPDELPAIHFRVFYHVSDSSPSADLLIKSLNDFKESSKQTANLAFSLIPACSLQNVSTFISILGIRHE